MNRWMVVLLALLLALTFVAPTLGVTVALMAGAGLLVWGSERT